MRRPLWLLALLALPGLSVAWACSTSSGSGGGGGIPGSQPDACRSRCEDAGLGTVIRAEGGRGGSSGTGSADTGGGGGHDAGPSCDAQSCSTGTCDDAGCTGATTTSPSCEVDGGGGACGAAKESCCTSDEVPGGRFDRTYVNTGTGPTGQADSATVSGFRLDRYLVTVGRFRGFVAAWAGGYMPAAGAGRQVQAHGGKGLANSTTPGTYEPGWVASDDANIAPTTANLTSCGANSTWTATPGNQEELPINCVDWAEAYAFCIWDGGFLPSEAEWEYAAAGGSEERQYPWGTTAPGADNAYAIYGDGAGDCYYPKGMLAPCTGAANIAPVGTATLGAAKWGALDMVGQIFVWNLDWYASYVTPCTDCAYLGATPMRSDRGGNFSDGTSYLLPTNRGNYAATGRGGRGIGIRCARVP